VVHNYKSCLESELKELLSKRPKEQQATFVTEYFIGKEPECQQLNQMQYDMMGKAINSIQNSYAPMQSLNYLVDYIVLYLSAFYVGGNLGTNEKIKSDRVSLVPDESNATYKLVFDYNMFIPQDPVERNSLLHLSLVVFNSAIFQSTYAESVSDAEKWEDEMKKNPNSAYRLQFPFSVRMEKKTRDQFENFFTRNQVDPSLEHHGSKTIYSNEWKILLAERSPWKYELKFTLPSNSNLNPTPVTPSGQRDIESDLWQFNNVN